MAPPPRHLQAHWEIVSGVCPLLPPPRGPALARLVPSAWDVWCARTAMRLWTGGIHWTRLSRALQDPKSSRSVFLQARVVLSRPSVSLRVLSCRCGQGSPGFLLSQQVFLDMYPCRVLAASPHAGLGSGPLPACSARLCSSTDQKAQGQAREGVSGQKRGAGKTACPAPAAVHPEQGPSWCPLLSGAPWQKCLVQVCLPQSKHCHLLHQALGGQPRLPSRTSRGKAGLKPDSQRSEAEPQQTSAGWLPGHGQLQCAEWNRGQSQPLGPVRQQGLQPGRPTAPGPVRRWNQARPWAAGSRWGG